MKTARFHRPALCPHCGDALDSATAFNEALPSVGDLAVCINCGELNQFGVGSVLDKAPDGVLMELEPDARAKTLAAMAYFKARGPLRQRGTRQ